MHHVSGDGDGGIVAGGEHKTVEQILDGPLFTGLQAHEGIVFFVEIDRVVRNRSDLIQTAGFDGQHAGEDLYGAARGALNVGVLFDAVQSRGGVAGVHQDGIALPQRPYVKIVRPGNGGGQQQEDEDKSQ